MDRKLVRCRSFRVYPTRSQVDALNAQLGFACDLYNAALQQRRMAWRTSRTSVSRSQQQSELTELRREVPWLLPENGMNAWAQQDVLKRLDLAFAAFFRRVARGETPGFPRFKPKTRYRTLAFDLAHNGGGCKVALDGRSVSIQGVGRMRMRGGHDLEGCELLQARVTRERTGRWKLTVMVRVEAPAPLPSTGRSCGLDLGVLHDVTLADDAGGHLHLDGPRALRAAQADLKKAQRAHSRKKRGSTRRRTSARQLARKHERVANVRRRFHLDTARAIVAQHDLIAVEDLAVANMVRRPKARPRPDGSFAPNRASQKAGLNRSLLDAAPAAFITVLSSKAEEAGRRVVRVDPRGTSQRCSSCGSTPAVKLALGDRTHTCASCGSSLDRDVNAARNILILGLNEARAESGEVALLDEARTQVARAA